MGDWRDGQAGGSPRRKAWAAVALPLAVAVLAAAAALLYQFVLKGEAKLSDFRLSCDSPVYGQALTASATLENGGYLKKDYRAVLTVDGRAAATRDITLEREKPVTLRFDLTSLKPGSHTVGIAGAGMYFRVLKPAAFEVSDIAFAPTQFYVGDAVTASATVRNTGEAEGAFSTAFAYDGEALETSPQSVAPGSSAQVQARFIVSSRGAHAVSLGDRQKQFTALNPANVAVVDMKLSKSWALPGETVSADVTLRNTGDAAGTYNLKLLVNGDAAQTSSVSVGGGASRTVSFQLTEPAVGKYVVSAGSVSRSLSVVEVSRPEDGALLVKDALSSGPGDGLLTLFNRSDKDAVFVLVSADAPGRAVLAVYLRAGGKEAQCTVKSGRYFGFYASGEDFAASAGAFMTGADCFEYKNEMDFGTFYYELILPSGGYWDAVAAARFPSFGAN